jgi:hypothetical protein
MKFQWGWCDLCDSSFVYCPKCGNNCCSGTYGKINDQTCDVCELAYQYQHLAMETKTEPSKEYVEKNPPSKIPHWFYAECKTISKILDMPKEEKLKHIKEHPEEHKHCYNELICCCFIDEKVDDELIEAHNNIPEYNVPKKYLEEIELLDRIFSNGEKH